MDSEKDDDDNSQDNFPSPDPPLMNSLTEKIINRRKI